MKNIYKKIVALVATMSLTLSCSSITGIAAVVPTSTNEPCISQRDIASPNDSYSSGGIYRCSNNIRASCKFKNKY